MPLSSIFFLCALAFLSGVAYAGIGLPLLFYAVPAAALLSALFIFNVDIRIAGLAALLLVLGGVYYAADDAKYRATLFRIPQAIEARGFIANDPNRTADSQSFYFKTDLGKFLVETGPEPRYEYGDTLKISGKVSPPQDNSYGKYLAKEKLSGTIFDPQLVFVSAGGGNRALAFFIRAKNKIGDAYRRLLTPAEAALLSGITLGTSGDFPKTFLDALSLSGLRHIIAISGSNMSIIISIVLTACLFFLPRRPAFVITFAVVCLFTALTGFSVSALRAAIMAFIAGLAKETGRVYAPANALTLAAVVLTLANPKVLVFDAGFQLSFLAVLGIIYLVPVLTRALGIRDFGFMSWKQIFLMTVAAQAMTAPILIVQFQNFSLTAFVANMLVLGFIPLVTIGGFILAILSFLFYPAAALFSFFVAPFADLIILIVNLSAKIAVLFNPSLGFTGIAVYYSALILFIYRIQRQKLPQKKNAN
ncbi:MAG: ComEC/Rec2 family competence protein [Patescibacteria group bacterium]